MNQARANGSTITAPDTSPSHHVRHTDPTALPLIASPSHSDRVPIVALTTVPATIATNTPARSGTVASGASRRVSFRSSTAATRTSHRLPKLWPTAAPTGSVE